MKLCRCQSLGRNQGVKLIGAVAIGMSVSEIRVRKRKRLREKELKALAEDLLNATGVEIIGPKDTVDTAEGPECELIIINNVIEGMMVDGRPFPPIRLLKHKATKSFVSVDMGAVPIARGRLWVMSRIQTRSPSFMPGSTSTIPGAMTSAPLVTYGTAPMSTET